MGMVTVNQGTAKNISTDTVGTLEYGIVKLDMGTLGGTNPFSGTLPEITNLASGTLNRINQGSINVTAGTVTAGTINLAIRVGNLGTVESGTISRLEGGTLNLVTRVGNVGTLEVGTISALPNLPGGTLTNLVSGTINSATVVLNTGTINLGTVVGKDANAATQTGNPLSIGGTDSGGTLRTIKVDSGGLQRIGLDSGTVSVLPNIPGGTLGLVTRVGNLGTVESGTITSLGTLPGVGVVSNLTNGSIVMTGGTVTVLPNIPGGTLGVVSSIANLAAGTLTRLEQGSIQVTAGTITQGSIIVTNGTISHGTIDIGTVKLDGRTARNILSYGTTFGGTAAGYATLVGSAVVGAGTSLWVNDLSIVNASGNITCLVGFGTALNGSSVLAKGNFGTSSSPGIEKHFSLPVNAGMTNQDLVAYISGAGTVDFNVSYFISA